MVVVCLLLITSLSRDVPVFRFFGVVAITGVVGIGRCTLHRRNTGGCAQLAVVVLALFLYLQHAGGIVFLACRNVVAADAVDIAELTCSKFGGNSFVADEVMLGKAVLRHGDNRGGIDGVVLRFVELQCKPSEKGARSFFRGAA